MILINCDNLKVVLGKVYGGDTGSKIAVEYKNEIYMHKCCENLKSSVLS